ncbi:MAG: prepilin-type N-terminal cleavage/methylation domain-containing protein [Phycisphaerae bacterium]
MSNSRLAFSLVELVIVVIIVGIIAAIAVPRVSRGSRGAAEAALRASLSSMRNAIDMYAAEHGAAWPAPDKTEDTFIDQLTKRTNAAGEVGTTAGEHICGPYLRSIPPIPVGPNVGASGVECKKDDPRKVYEDKTDVGWIHNYETGDIFANTDDLDERGVGYDTY